MEEKITAWVARDKDGTLCFYEQKPIKGENVWDYVDGGLSTVGRDEFLFEFPNVKWEDEEPTEVELTIKIKN